MGDGAVEVETVYATKCSTVPKVSNNRGSKRKAFKPILSNLTGLRSAFKVIRQKFLGIVND